MKRIVFLLLVFFISKSSVKASITKTFEDGETTYIVTDYYEEGSRGFILEKKGIDPFITSLVVQGETYIVNGVTELNNTVYVYGSAHIKGADTFYDAVIITFDVEGNFITKAVYDFDELEEVTELFNLDNVVIALVNEHVDDEGVFEFNGHHFLLLNQQLEIIKQRSLTIEVKSFELNSDKILLDYEYDGFYEIALTNQLEILLYDDLLDIPSNSVYSGSVEIDFINQATLNEDVVMNGVSIDYPGNYTLLYNENMYTFIVEPIVYGIENNGVYTESVSISVSNGNVLLNEDVFVDGTVISEPGNYEVVIQGINGYTKTLVFTITGDIDGLINHHVYYEPFEFYFNGEGYLNDQHQESPITISEDGNYTFKVIGERDYLETYQFELKQEQETSFIDFVQRFDIVVLVVTIIIGVVIIKKK